MRKALFLIAVLLLTALISHAQTEKGSQTLGADLGFTYLKSSGTTIDPYGNSTYNSGSKSTKFNIGPSYSYFIGDKLDLGTSLTYSQNTYSYPAGNNLEKQSEREFGGAIYLRKYFMFQEKIGLRAGPRIGYYRDINKITYEPANDIYNQDAKTDNFVGGLNLDLVYYPSKHLGFTASLANLYYTHFKSGLGTQGNAKGDNFNASFINDGLSLSVFYAFGK